MKVKAIINYTDTQLKRDIKAGETFEVRSEKRLKQLLGDNPGKYICVEVIQDADTKAKAKANAKNK